MNICYIFDTPYIAISTAGAGVSFPEDVPSRQFDPGSDWHTYRIEVEGNEMRVFVDGSQLVETVDNTLISNEGGQLAIFSYYLQVNVRSFKVIAL
jgi:hypothetical protein